jgi:hypothetical protein
MLVSTYFAADANVRNAKLPAKIAIDEFDG